MMNLPPFWLADDGRVFELASLKIVPKTDLDYVKFRNDGGFPRQWPRDDAGAQTDDALRAVLDFHGITTKGV